MKTWQLLSFTIEVAFTGSLITFLSFFLFECKVAIKIEMTVAREGFWEILFNTLNFCLNLCETIHHVVFSLRTRNHLQKFFCNLVDDNKATASS